MSRPYHTLLVRYENGWCPEFGDFSRAVVDCERQDYRDGGHRLRDLRIVTTAPDQGAIDHAVREVNAGAGFLARFN